MRKWMIEFLRKFENRGIKIARVSSILITKSINLQLFTLILYGVEARCHRSRFSVLRPFIEKSMVGKIEWLIFILSTLIMFFDSFVIVCFYNTQLCQVVTYYSSVHSHSGSSIYFLELFLLYAVPPSLPHNTIDPIRPSPFTMPRLNWIWIVRRKLLRERRSCHEPCHLIVGHRRRQCDPSSAQLGSWGTQEIICTGFRPTFAFALYCDWRSDVYYKCMLLASSEITINNNNDNNNIELIINLKVS